MNKINIICGNTDLGVHIDGASLGPIEIVKELDNNLVNEIISIPCDNTNKDKSNNKLKNLDRINDYNTLLYEAISKTLKDNNFPILLGGDHTVAIASALASLKKYEKIGIIWIDSHGDFNTKTTTQTQLHSRITFSSYNWL